MPRTRDPWKELRKRGRKLKVDLDLAEEEIDRDEELWHKKLTAQ